VALAYAIARIYRTGISTRAYAPVYYLLIAVLGIGWLLFLPNTCYLLTEWRHYFDSLGHTDIINRSLDVRDTHAIATLVTLSLAFLMYSLFGLFTFALGIRPIARLLREWMVHYWLLGFIFFPLMSLGVYLGLIHRFNSWDLARDPGIIFQQGVDAIVRPFSGMAIIILSLFLWFSYYLCDVWIDGICMRFIFLRKNILENHD